MERRFDARADERTAWIHSDNYLRQFCGYWQMNICPPPFTTISANSIEVSDNLIRYQSVCAGLGLILRVHSGSVFIVNRLLCSFVYSRTSISNSFIPKVILHEKFFVGRSFETRIVSLHSLGCGPSHRPLQLR